MLLSASHKGKGKSKRVPCKRLNPKVLVCCHRANNVNTIGLPLGMSFAAVRAQFQVVGGGREVVTMGVGVTDEVEAGKEGAKGNVAVDEGSDMGGASFNKGAK
ncbi:hypothetical protein VNO78_05321 [Psophocarpus tetragonolobus]|uniref:Uncharacterized protein n=1 Tax=Psophocarpus tetragonolobus TaxID=3891 RepID=A0AAN9SRM6_PSOTE